MSRTAALGLPRSHPCLAGTLLGLLGVTVFALTLGFALAVVATVFGGRRMNAPASDSTH